MVGVFFEANDIKQLSNKELIQRHTKLENLIGKARVNGASANSYEDMMTIYMALDAEIDFRLDCGKMDEDELEEDL